MSSGTPKSTGAALVVGGGVAGIQCSLDLAEGGYKVFLVDKAPALGGHMAQLDKTFPTNDCSMCTLAPKLVEAGRHLNIEILTNSELTKLQGEPGNFAATVYHHARFVDPDKCTSCGECVPVCPITVKDQYNEDLGERKAIYKLYPQAIPNTYVVDKKGYAPCKSTCPVETSAQGYIALIAEGRFADAYRVASEPNPFPSVCGRICAHPCETACTRGSVDEPLAIAGLKRFVCDVAGPQELPETLPVTYDEKVAIIGGGPAGLSCARDLAQLGYATTVFEALPVAGGMLRVGIPDHRMPPDVLQKEIDQICALGVDLRLNQRCGADFTVDGLLGDGYQAVFLAPGLHTSAPSPVKGDDLDGCLPAVEFLRDLNLGNPPVVGDRVVVIGGGDVAFDAARAASRLTSRSGKAPEVTIAYRRSRDEMPASAEEIDEGIDEELKIDYLVAPVEIAGENGKVARHQAAELQARRARREGPPAPRAHRRLVRRDPLRHRHRRHRPGDRRRLQEGPRRRHSRVERGQDRRRDHGHRSPRRVRRRRRRAARSPHGDRGDRRRPQGRRQHPQLPARRAARRLAAAAARRGPSRRRGPRRGRPASAHPHARVAGRRAPPHLGRGPQGLHRGAGRSPRPSAACSAPSAPSAWSACAPAARAPCCTKSATASTTSRSARSSWPPASTRTTPARRASTATGATRTCSAPSSTSACSAPAGPSIGEILRPSDQAHPKRIAFIQCVGSRDQEHEYCSSVCCMYANKQAMLTIDHLPGVTPEVFLMDMRAMGKGFDVVLPARPRPRREVHALAAVDDQGGPAHARTSSSPGRTRPACCAPASTTWSCSASASSRRARRRRPPASSASRSTVTASASSRSTRRSTTSREGVFVAGPFSEPKDIPDSVAQASAAAAQVMTGLADSRGTLTVDKEYPTERDVVGEEPRVGVFVCHCGSNIAGVIDVEGVAEYAMKLPGVVYANDTMYTCSSDSLTLIKETIEKEHLNRVVVASCTPRTHEPIFQDTLREAGLNPFLFEMANIRDQASWVHAQ